MILAGIVSLITIIAAILGVGWKLGSIATGIETQIVEVKGEMRTLNAISGERINGIERRLTEIEQLIRGDRK
jgi:CRISPR/Cas system CMR-associated protein Cmr1 (group 7 of RAMP superfamily)